MRHLVWAFFDRSHHRSTPCRSIRFLFYIYTLPYIIVFMSTVTISSKYQIVIPKEIRDKENIKPGQEVQVFYYDGRIEIVPLKKMKNLRGIARGIDTAISRDKDRF